MQALLSRLSFWRPRKEVALPQIELVGERIWLRPVELGDAAEMFPFVADPEVVRFLPWQTATELRSVKLFLEQQRERRRQGESLAFSLLLKETGRVIGSTDIMQLKSADRKVELGYILAQEFWGQGLMTEAAALCRDYIFTSLERQTLVAFADQENTGSRRVMEKIGMTEAGSEWRVVKEHNRLYIRYELTRATWEKLVH